MNSAEAAPPLRDIPVAVPGDLLLVQEPGLLVWVGAFAVSSAGFEFALRITVDVRDPAAPMPEPFALHLRERDHRTWLEVRFADGRTCAADLANCTWPDGQQDIRVTFMFAGGRNQEGRAESQWRVSPLPPPGPLELTIHLNGRAGPTGTAAWGGFGVRSGRPTSAADSASARAAQDRGVVEHGLPG
jgi:hypothetical protein